MATPGSTNDYKNNTMTTQTLETQSHHDANFVAIVATTSSATNDGKVGIMATLGFHNEIETGSTCIIRLVLPLGGVSVMKTRILAASSRSPIRGRNTDIRTAWKTVGH